MITDMNARVAMAQKLSIPQLQQAIKNGTIPAYVGVPLLQDKMRQQQQMQMAAQQQSMSTERPPIAEEIMAQAGAMGGVDQLPSNLPITDDEEEYAGGGIVAFSGDRTSDVRDPDRRSPTDRGLDELIARINRSANNNIVIPRASNTGVAGATPEVFAVDGVSPEFGGSSITADQDAERVARITAERAAAEDAQRQRFLRTAAPQLARPEASPLGYNAEDVAGTTYKGASLPGAGTPPTGAAPTGIAPRAATPATATEAAPAPMSALDQYAAMLMEERKGIAKDRQQAKAMALLQTGLGIAGGTSPNPFANISQGALQGTQAYQQEMRGIRKEDADRLKQLMSLGIGKEKLALEARKLGIEDRKVDAIMARIGAGSEDRASQRAFENQRRYGQLYEVALKNREASIAKAYPMGELSPPINGMSYSQAMAAARNDPALRQYQKMAFPELNLSEPTAPKSDFSGFSLVPKK